MNSFCPSCDMPLRNPKACDCGWVLPHVTVPKVYNAKTERSKELARKCLEFAHSLNKAKRE